MTCQRSFPLSKEGGGCTTSLPTLAAYPGGFPMKYRKLGRNGPEVSAIGLGCMSMGIASVYSSSVRNDDDAVALIHRALELGVTLLDTADIYGDSERQVGKAIRGRRDEVVLATKFGFTGAVGEANRAINGSATYVRQ